eukprot:c7601_g1_i2.p3 GENE.c7601_g1_i2~~c7601_g1_i2.p3  ORF type:complete len:100 (-),score=5.19 c7601_g1_i2:286-585(-)
MRTPASSAAVRRAMSPRIAASKKARSSGEGASKVGRFMCKCRSGDLHGVVRGSELNGLENLVVVASNTSARAPGCTGVSALDVAVSAWGSASATGCSFA